MGDLPLYLLGFTSGGFATAWAMTIRVLLARVGKDEQ